MAVTISRRVPVSRRLRAIDHRPVPRPQAQENRSLGSPLQRRASLATVLPARGDGRNYREWLDRSWCHAIVNAARTRGEALTTSRPSRPKIDQPLLIAPFSPRVRKDGRHRNLARSDRDPEDRFPSKLTARREGVLAGALRAGKRKLSVSLRRRSSSEHTVPVRRPVGRRTRDLGPPARRSALLLQSFRRPTPAPARHRISPCRSTHESLERRKALY